MSTPAFILGRKATPRSPDNSPVRYWIGRGLMLAGIFTCLYVFWLGMTERIRPGAELMAAVGSLSLFAIGWLLAGGGRK